MGPFGVMLLTSHPQYCSGINFKHTSQSEPLIVVSLAPQTPASIISFLGARTNKQLLSAKVDSLVRLFPAYDHQTVEKMLRSRVSCECMRVC